uniref:Spermatosis and centriole associated 1 like n=1 Tax=Salmo trutta TaxID=8032 RepID=A0A674CAS6_SALTR
QRNQSNVRIHQTINNPTQRHGGNRGLNTQQVNEGIETRCEENKTKQMENESGSMMARRPNPCRFRGWCCNGVYCSDPERLVGEIAFQLDRRILSYVFQGQTRLYGFTVLNIRDKIIQVSTHPLTGKVDEGYRLQLSQRHAELMAKLKQLGYSMTLHPPFTEFIINTYGILKQRADSYSAQELGYNSSDFLRRVVINAAPCKLLKDLLLLFSCLSFMARQDGKPLFLW